MDSVSKLKQRAPSWIGLFCVLMLAAPVLVLIARTIWTYRAYPFDADEAIHANKALAILLALRA
ncbi:MAG: hypothetical protein P8Z33_14060, partial [Gammaproteobacteria bacterium]